MVISVCCRYNYNNGDTLYIKGGRYFASLSKAVTECTDDFFPATCCLCCLRLKCSHTSCGKVFPRLIYPSHSFGRPFLVLSREVAVNIWTWGVRALHRHNPLQNLKTWKSFDRVYIQLCTSYELLVTLIRTCRNLQNRGLSSHIWNVLSISQHNICNKCLYITTGIPTLY